MNSLTTYELTDSVWTDWQRMNWLTTSDWNGLMLSELSDNYIWTAWWCLNWLTTSEPTDNIWTDIWTDWSTTYEPTDWEIKLSSKTRIWIEILDAITNISLIVALSFICIFDRIMIEHNYKSTTVVQQHTSWFCCLSSACNTNIMNKVKPICTAFFSGASGNQKPITNLLPIGLIKI